MPNFDGIGPLKRGRVIGRGLGICKKGSEDVHTKCSEEKNPVPERDFWGITRIWR